MNGRDNLTDVMRQIAARDETALAALISRTERLVFSIAFGILKEQGAAEEASGDVFHQVWRSAGTFDPRRGSVHSWLATMARSRAMDLSRRLQKHQHSEELNEQSCGWMKTNDDPEGRSIKSERGWRVRQALRQLSDDQRRIIETAYYRGCSHSEMARLFELPLGTVKTRARLAMRHLRQLLQPLRATGSLEIDL